ncbi:pyridoxal-phosphate dependent enzyme [Streptomyces diacarni]|uniref:Pyridoxal-phosphate dependent enzyme n=1 Tax=Streptomyces diacarni TaxID=2800381 RepID=A0A367FCM8_9ACTN|nr:serine/threonine dehydratase [Streptomyces diacarni]RCG28126.1 pyridoxal-phosphate dependent enzyme [Streptomyces diacarni]
MHHLSYGDVKTAADRVADRVRPVTVARADAGSPGAGPDTGGAELYFALEFMQHTGSFKARGALNFLLAHREQGELPDAGVTLASGGNAGLACAWAARGLGVPATVFLPETAPRTKVERLRAYGADVRLAGAEYAEAAAACEAFATDTGALPSHAYDHPLIAAGAGTMVEEIRAQVPLIDTVVVAVGGGGLFAGVAAAAQHHGIRVVAVEPERCRALNAALEAGRVVDVEIDSVAADSLGARRATPMALAAAGHRNVRSVLVGDDAVAAARHGLWEHYRLAVENAAGTAVAGVAGVAGCGNAHAPYVPAAGERVAVVLCGSNADPAELARDAGPSLEAEPSRDAGPSHEAEPSRDGAASPH